MIDFPNYHVVRRPEGGLALWSDIHDDFVLVDCEREDIVQYILTVCEGDIEYWISQSLCFPKKDFSSLQATRLEIEKLEKAREAFVVSEVKHQATLEFSEKEKVEEKLLEAFADLGEGMEH